MSRLMGVLLATLVSACGLGTDHTLFFTTSNIGINLDTQPPTAEVSVARREGVIQPTFEGGRHLPVAASLQGQSGLLGQTPIRVGSVFAGGAAAELLTRRDDMTDAEAMKPDQSRICLTQEPRTSSGRPILPGAGDVRPFLFGTDTSIGLTVAWSGLTAGMPDSLQFGYRRKEIALAPIFGEANGCAEDAQGNTVATGTATHTYAVGMPSFIATVRTGVAATTPSESAFDLGQTFATGSAARLLATRPDMRTAFTTAIARETREATATIVGVYGMDARGRCINAWLNGPTVDAATRQLRLAAANAWLKGTQLTATPSFIIEDAGMGAFRARMISDLSIPCVT